MLIETEGLEEEGMIIDMKQTYEQGREQNRLNIGLHDTAEWIYRKTTKGARPILTRQLEVALVEDIEMGKAGRATGAMLRMRKRTQAKGSANEV